MPDVVGIARGTSALWANQNTKHFDDFAFTHMTMKFGILKRTQGSFPVPNFVIARDIRLLGASLYQKRWYAGSVVVSGGDNEDAATEERISQILSEAQAAMQKKHSDEQVSADFLCYLLFIVIITISHSSLHGLAWYWWNRVYN